MGCHRHVVEKEENVFGGLVLTDESIDAVEEERKRRDPEPPLQRGRRRFRSPWMSAVASNQVACFFYGKLGGLVTAASCLRNVSKQQVYTTLKKTEYMLQPRACFATIAV